MREHALLELIGRLEMEVDNSWLWVIKISDFLYNWSLGIFFCGFLLWWFVVRTAKGRSE